MATHFMILAGKMQWTEEPDGLPSMGSQRVRQTEETEQKCMQWKKNAKENEILLSLFY